MIIKTGGMRRILFRGSFLVSGKARILIMTEYATDRSLLQFCTRATFGSDKTAQRLNLATFLSFNRQEAILRD